MKQMLTIITVTFALLVANVTKANESSLANEPTAQVGGVEVKNLAVVERLSPNGFVRGRIRVVDTVVLHNIHIEKSNNPYEIESILSMMRRLGVSAHYLIARDGTVYQLVSEDDKSYHAGASRMPDGRTEVNNFSIGIELVNGYDDLCTEEQYKALESLMMSIRSRHSIQFVVAHGEIASERRTDPWNLDWERVRKW